MRVVSQSKDVSLDFDRAVFTANHGMITAMVDGKTFTIGTYANLGREKEVFSDMHKAFSAFQVISTNMINNRWLKCLQYLKTYRSDALR